MERDPMCNALKSFYFCKKEFSFYFAKFSWKWFFWKSLSGKSFQIAILLISWWKCWRKLRLHLYWIKTDRQLLTLHNYTFNFSSVYLFRSNYVECLFIVTLAPIKSKASSPLVFGNSINLNLLTETYIEGATPLFNG